MTGITTSIRLSLEMRSRLESASKILHKGKSSIISDAIDAYLKTLEHEDSVQVARRQSLLVQNISDEEEVWEKNTDVAEGNMGEKR